VTSKKSDGLLREETREIPVQSPRRKAVFPVRVLWPQLQVSRAGFYGLAARPAGAARAGDERLGLEIRRSTRRLGNATGAPGFTRARERGAGRAASAWARLMRVRGLAARRPPAVSGHDAVAASVSHRPQRLARHFERTGPDQAVGHRHHLHSEGEGWLYHGVILDLCSRFAVGWAMNERITADLTLDALGMALARRQPAAGAAPSFRSRSQ